MKTIKSLKDITTLEVGDKVVFGNLEYEVSHENGYYLQAPLYKNDKIFTNLNISKRDFVKNLGINTLPLDWDFPEVSSLEALTAIVSALLKEYEKQNELPKTWEEFCKKNYARDVYFIANNSIVTCISGYMNSITDKNLCTSKQEAEAFLALMQLRQLRKCYVGNWEPDFGKKGYYGIVYTYNGIKIEDYHWNYRSLSFPTEKLAEQFLNNFKDLLEIAKPLL